MVAFSKEGREEEGLEGGMGRSVRLAPIGWNSEECLDPGHPGFRDWEKPG